MTDQTLTALLRHALHVAMAASAAGCGGATAPSAELDAAVAPDVADVGAPCDGSDADGGCPAQTQPTCGVGMACLVGRRPWNRVTAASPAPDRTVGDWFARTAAMEAASVGAFRVLGIELAAHGAPKVLLKQARRAARDEATHTRMALRLARRFGVAARVSTGAARPHRSLRAMAIENVVEGCVRETFGALVAGWQARAARDPEVARCMRAVSVDETRHAALAWRVACWAEGRLASPSLLSVRQAKRHAIDQLREEFGEPSTELRRLAGLPTGIQSRVLLVTLDRLLWSGSLAKA